MSAHRPHTHAPPADESGLAGHRSAAATAVPTVVVTVSDTRTLETDAGGALAEELLRGGGHPVVDRAVVPDEPVAIAGALQQALGRDDVRAVVFTGGTGVAPRDVTPEATRSVLDREVPGIPEALRRDSAAKTPHGLLSRGVAGIAGGALVVNLPGSPGGCRDGYAVLRPVLPHALALLADRPTDHVQT